MRSGTAKKARGNPAMRQRQVNLRVEPTLYQALETLARQERRSVPQMARHLLEDGLRSKTGQPPTSDDTAASDIAALAARGGAFAWLADEPELYDDTSGEPL